MSHTTLVSNSIQRIRKSNFRSRKDWTSIVSCNWQWLFWRKLLLHRLTIINPAQNIRTSLVDTQIWVSKFTSLEKNAKRMLIEMKKNRKFRYIFTTQTAVFFSVSKETRQASEKKNGLIWMMNKTQELNAFVIPRRRKSIVVCEVRYKKKERGYEINEAIDQRAWARKNVSGGWEKTSLIQLMRWSVQRRKFEYKRREKVINREREGEKKRDCIFEKIH